MKIMSANRIAPDGTQRFAASHLGLLCLPMSDKMDAMLIRVNQVTYIGDVGYRAYGTLVVCVQGRWFYPGFPVSLTA